MKYFDTIWPAGAELYLYLDEWYLKDNYESDVFQITNGKSKKRLMSEMMSVTK